MSRITRKQTYLILVVVALICAIGGIYQWAHYAGQDHPGRVGVVDVEYIRQKSDIDKGIEADVRSLLLVPPVKDLRQKLEAELTKQAKEMGDRPKQKSDKPTAAEKKLIDEWVGKMEKLERARMDAVNRIRQAYNQQRQANQQAIRAADTKILNRIKPVVQRIARERGLDIVVTSSSVFVHDEAVDITADLLKEVNKLASGYGKIESHSKALQTDADKPRR
jgi:Skp family chaperone for outer membrane proteins